MTRSVLATDSAAQRPLGGRDADGNAGGDERELFSALSVHIETDVQQRPDETERLAPVLSESPFAPCLQPIRGPRVVRLDPAEETCVHKTARPGSQVPKHLFGDRAFISRGAPRRPPPGWPTEPTRHHRRGGAW